MRWLLFALLALTACEQKTNADRAFAASIKAFDDKKSTSERKPIRSSSRQGLSLGLQREGERADSAFELR